MLQTIVDAVQIRRILSFVYDGLSRTVEPHAVGRSTAGHDLLRCYQKNDGPRIKSHATAVGIDWRSGCKEARCLNLLSEFDLCLSWIRTVRLD
jgi:hypothetical protein